ncbi:MAG: hypothetical protein EBX92_08475 [Actinobacteria bacterium]|nr:hypothetical protein [Actinomycetota bacterium]
MSASAQFGLQQAPGGAVFELVRLQTKGQRPRDLDHGWGRNTRLTEPLWMGKAPGDATATK